MIMLSSGTAVHLVLLHLLPSLLLPVLTAVNRGGCQLAARLPCTCLCVQASKPAAGLISSTPVMASAVLRQQFAMWQPQGVTSRQ
jgi:hypothetical protein